MKRIFFIFCIVTSPLCLQGSNHSEIPMAQAAPESELLNLVMCDIQVVSRMITPHNLFIELKGKITPEALSYASFRVVQEPYYTSHQLVGTLYLVLRNRMHVLTDDTTTACLHRLLFQDHEQIYIVAPTAQEHNQNTLLKFPLQQFKSQLK